MSQLRQVLLRSGDVGDALLAKTLRAHEVEQKVGPVLDDEIPDDDGAVALVVLGRVLPLARTFEIERAMIGNRMWVSAQMLWQIENYDLCVAQRSPVFNQMTSVYSYTYYCVFVRGLVLPDADEQWKVLWHETQRR